MAIARAAVAGRNDILASIDVVRSRHSRTSILSSDGNARTSKLSRLMTGGNFVALIRRSTMRRSRSIIDRHVESWWTAFDTAQDQMLHGIRADCATHDGMANTGSGIIDVEDLQRSQHLYELALALLPMRASRSRRRAANSSGSFQ